jgi:hypothetical protein
MEAMVTEAPHVPPGVDPTVPTAARIYDWMLRGRNNFPCGVARKP